MLFSIPCTFMRGGTSKGPYFHARDLPQDAEARDRLLLLAMGSPHVRQIDGIGGGDTLTSKVVIVSPSQRPGVDIDYLFAQVSIETATVDTTPNCGNMLAGVGPFAIENGLVVAADPVTTLRIFNVNTNKVVEAVVQTPGGKVSYEGDARIDGVPGTGAPIQLNFLNATGAKTGRLFPTGSRTDVVDGVTVSLIDFATPLVFVPAVALGKTGHESKQALDADASLKARLESIRLQIAEKAGLGDVHDKVLPKIALVARPAATGVIASRYFTPWSCHSAYAVTGALCLSATSVIPGTVVNDLARLDEHDPCLVTIEQPAGTLDIRLQIAGDLAADEPSIVSAGLIRTARKLFQGNVLLPLESAAAADVGLARFIDAE
ncbi:4-oxalomesaconate tautomerase [Azospira restricta]|uniref:4-oxalomesaconate tautomerase n=1 Tax=Azospira restricta TaxID=404405 RepID=A0A974SNL3_9RHOO|nr:4-oxalomesaconate tautomerase [Azospira restricta]QRJ63293.1 4-oxalomesaconate tautomerase [Azospira restricta]